MMGDVLVPTFTLGDRLRKSLEVADLTVEEMAQRLGVSDRTIRNYTSERTPIKRGFTLQWALICGVDPNWLIGYEADDDDLRSRCTSRDGPGPGQLRLQLAA